MFRVQDDREDFAMPRRFDGPMLETIPQRPERNALPDRVQDLLDRYSGDHGGPARTGELGQAGQHGPVLGEFIGGDRPDKVAPAPRDAPVRDGSHQNDILAQLMENLHGGHGTDQNGFTPGRGGPSDARVAASDVSTTALNFAVDGEYTRHLDHYNSQALSMHPDWYML